MNIAYNMDCMQGMKQYPDKYFDLAVVDPPYGIRKSREAAAKSGRISGEGGARWPRNVYAFKTWDDEPPPVEYFQELRRVSKNQIIFGANHFISRIDRADSPCWIVWDKQNGETDFADCELAWASFKSPVRICHYKWNGFLQGNAKDREKRIHPTQKPVALYAWIYQRYAKPGDKILDTHLGSGSSRIAAYDAGLDFVGYELDPDYFRMEEERFERHISQTSLFV